MFDVAVEVQAVTCLDNIMYVVCWSSSTIVLYNTDTFSPLDVVINIEGSRCCHDIIVCRDDRQLYVADWHDDCIWRVSADDHSYVKWLTTTCTFHAYTNYRMSLKSGQLLVTQRQPPRLRQYSTTDRQLLRVVELHDPVDELSHAVETTRQTFVITYQDTSLDDEQFAVSDLFSFCHWQ